MTGRRPLGANVAGFAAAWMLSKVPADTMNRSVQFYRETGREETGREIAATWADIREAARQWQESRDVSDPGSVEVAPPPDRACSGVSPLAVDTATAAGILNRSDRRVRQLLTDGKLAGRKLPSGTWVVDPGDLQRLLIDRRLAA